MYIYIYIYLNICIYLYLKTNLISTMFNILQLEISLHKEYTIGCHSGTEKNMHI